MKPKKLWVGAFLGIMGLGLSACAGDDLEIGEDLVEVFNQEAQDRDLGIHYWLGGAYSVIDGQAPDPPPDMPFTIFVETDLGESDMAGVAEALTLLEEQKNRTVEEGLQFGIYRVTAMVDGTEVAISPGMGGGINLDVVSNLVGRDIQRLSIDAAGPWAVDTTPCDAYDIACLENHIEDLVDSADQIVAGSLNVTVPDHEGQSWMKLRVIPDEDNPLSGNRLEEAIDLVKDINELGVKVSSLELGYQSQLFIHSHTGDETMLAVAAQVADRARELPEWQRWMQQKSLEGEVIYGPTIHTRSENSMPAVADLWISSSSTTPSRNDWEKTLKAQIEEVLP